MTQYLIAVVLTIIISYGLIEAWPLLAGPSLSVLSPTHSAAYPGGAVTIRGKATRVATLTLDGAPVLRDQQGNFSTTLIFPQGGSILTFTATDRFGRTLSTTRSIFVPTANEEMSFRSITQ